MTHTADLERTNLKIADWEQRRDGDAIAELDDAIADDLVFRRADGTIDGKATFMKPLRRGQPSAFASRASSAPAVHIAGARAVVTLVVTTTKADGTTSRYRNIRFFRREAGRWRLDCWFNDEVEDAVVMRAAVRA